MSNLKTVLAASIAAGVIAATSFVLPVKAAGTYDGNWVIDIPQNGRLETGGYACDATRLQVQVTNNVVSGNLQQSGQGGVTTGSSNRTAAPVSGNISQDGSVNVAWQGYKATGKLSGNTGKLTVQTKCGRASATATRLPS